MFLTLTRSSNKNLLLHTHIHSFRVGFAKSSQKLFASPVIFNAHINWSSAWKILCVLLCVSRNEITIVGILTYGHDRKIQNPNPNPTNLVIQKLLSYIKQNIPFKLDRNVSSPLESVKRTNPNPI